MKQKNGFENAKRRNHIKNNNSVKKAVKKNVRKKAPAKKAGSSKKATIGIVSALSVVIAIYLLFLFITPGKNIFTNPFNNTDSFMTSFLTSDANPFWMNCSAETFYKTSTPPEKPVNVERNPHDYNLFIVGKDRVGLNTDVMMVVNFNSATQKINILQVPRDTYIENPINRYGGNKRLNAIFAYWMNQNRWDYNEANDANKAGMVYLKNTIESTFGIAIDNYCMIDLEGFVNIIDAIGGVPMNVPDDLYYSDPIQNLHIDIKKGPQTLSGKDAEGFVRFRSGYAMGDLGRVDAQKLFISALMEKMTSSEWLSLDRLSEVAKLVINYCTTDLSLTDMIGYLKLIDFKTLSADSVTFYNAPGEPFTGTGGASYYSLYTKETLEVINHAFNVFTSPVTEKEITLIEQVKSGYWNTNTTGFSPDELGALMPHVWKYSEPVLDEIPPAPEEEETAKDIPEEDEVSVEEVDTEPPVQEPDTEDEPYTEGENEETEEEKIDE